MRKPIQAHLAHCISYLTTLIKALSERNQLDSAYLKQFELSRPSDNFIQSMHIQLLWAETLMSIFIKRAANRTER
ncbi:hypothetical protein ACP3V3_16985 [Vibrio sp. PNB22_3_1]